MDELQKRYREALVARIDALEVARQNYLDGEEDAEDSIRRLAHTLKGTGGTYGFDELSELAGILEQSQSDGLLPALDHVLKVMKDITGADEEREANILIIEDDPIAARILQVRLAGPNRDVLIAETAGQAEQIMEEKEVNLILLDLILPDTDGRNFLMALRENSAMAGIPVLVTSAKSGAGTKSECYALGADGYFEKPVDPEILSAAVAAKLQRAGEIVRESKRDPLTGLNNRAALSEAYLRMRSLADRSGEPLSLAILDIDHFKSVNDTYGHATGDEVLKGLARSLTASVRKSDVVGRWGGEEFVILFPNSEVVGAGQSMEKALETLRQETFTSEDGEPFQVTFSAGLAQAQIEQGLDELAAEADRLLYRAKEAGRNRILYEDTALVPASKGILLAEDDELIASVIKHRLEKEGFTIHHFPDGSTALMAAPYLDVDMALLDVKMPGMDGFELLSNLQKITHYRKIPIVMLTSMGSEKDIVRGFDLGASDYIMKPFSPVELVARIRRLIKS